MKNITLTKKTKTITYPSKTTINLITCNEKKVNNKITIVAFVAFVVVLVLFTKFAVIDRIAEADKVTASYNALLRQISEYQDNNKEYSSVKAEYDKVSAAGLTEEELAIVDRSSVLDLVDQTILSRGNVSSVNITGVTVKVVMTNISLSTVSELVTSLNQSNMVSNVSVTTASNANDKSGGSGSVTANIIITLSAGGNSK